MNARDLFALAILAVSAILAYAGKRRRWIGIIDFHFAYMSSPFKDFGTAFRPYMSFSGAPLALYLASVMHGLLGTRRARAVYDLFFAGVGLMVFVACLGLGMDMLPASLVAALFYATCFTPVLNHIFFEPEWPAFLLTMTGAALAALGVQAHVPALAVAGAAVAGLSFWCKLHVLVPLWVPLHAWVGGLGPITAGACLVVQAFLFVFSMYSSVFYRLPEDQTHFLGLHKENSGLRYFLKYIFIEIALNLRRYDGGFVAGELRRMLTHSAVLSPLLVLLPAWYAWGGAPQPLRWSMTGFMILSLMSCLSRMRYIPIYLMLVQFPLCLAAVQVLGAGLEGAAFWAGWGTVLVLLLAAAGMDLRRPTDYRAFYRLGKGVVDYLRGRVGEEDAIFQNGLHTEIYAELPARTPPNEMWFADRFPMSLRSPRALEQAMEWFRRNRPVYYVGCSATLNLNHLERVTGLRYEIEDASGYHIYRLAEVVEPEPSPEDHDELFRFDAQRSLRDKAAFLEFDAARRALLGDGLGRDALPGRVAVAPASQAGRLLADYLERNGLASVAGLFDLPEAVPYERPGRPVLGPGDVAGSGVDTLVVCSTGREARYLVERVRREGLFARVLAAEEMPAAQTTATAA